MFYMVFSYTLLIYLETTLANRSVTQLFEITKTKTCKVNSDTTCSVLISVGNILSACSNMCARSQCQSSGALSLEKRFVGKFL